jgi:hypothetical protein
MPNTEKKQPREAAAEVVAQLGLDKPAKPQGPNLLEIIREVELKQPNVGQEVSQILLPEATPKE